MILISGSVFVLLGAFTPLDMTERMALPLVMTTRALIVYSIFKK